MMGYFVTDTDLLWGDYWDSAHAMILRWEQDARDIQAFEWLRENL